MIRFTDSSRYDTHSKLFRTKRHSHTFSRSLRNAIREGLCPAAGNIAIHSAIQGKDILIAVHIDNSLCIRINASASEELLRPFRWFTVAANADHTQLQAGIGFPVRFDRFDCDVKALSKHAPTKKEHNLLNGLYDDLLSSFFPGKMILFCSAR